MQELVEGRNRGRGGGGGDGDLLETAVLHALAFGGDVDEVVFDILGREGDILDAVFGEQDRLDGVHSILQHFVRSTDGTAFVARDLFLQLLNSLVLVLERDSHGFVFDDALDAAHVFQGLSQIAVERHVLVILPEFFGEEFPPEIDFLLSIELRLDDVDVHQLRLGCLHDAGLLVEGAVVLQVHSFPHQERLPLQSRIMQVPQELFGIGGDLFH